MPATPVTIARLREAADHARSHGVTCLNIATLIRHDERILLLYQDGDGFLDPIWEPPKALLFTNEDPRDAVLRSLAHTGLTLDQLIGYHGRHDTDLGHGQQARTLYLTANVTDPTGTCRSASIGHLWARIDQLPANTAPNPNTLAQMVEHPHLPGATRPTAPLANPLRARAHGLYPHEAACELLIHSSWLHRDDFIQFVELDVHIANGTEVADINWPAAITALDTGGLPCSGGEQRILRLAASLAAGLPVSLRDALTGLDDHNTNLVVKAVLHTSGQRPQPQSTMIDS